MASKFSKHGILSGRIDHYCLTCAEQLKTEDETLAHIVDFQHKENWKAIGYFEKYKTHFIRKIKGLYFCEACSLTFPTAKKVELHIDQQSHLDNKSKINPWLKRVENDIIAFNQFIISDDAWNGCVEDTCVLCNIEFDDRDSHKKIRSHVLNLINSEVFFDDSENTVVRTIDDRSKQCLTCNVIIGDDTTSHFGTVEHKAAYKLYDVTVENNETKCTTPTSNVPTETQNVKVSENKTNTEDVKKEVNGIPNVDNKTGGKPANKDLSKDAIINNMKKMMKESLEKENAEALDKIYSRNLGTRNYIADVDGQKWCFLCELIIEGTPEYHTSGKHHQIILKFHKDRLAANRNNRTGTDKEFTKIKKFQKGNVSVDLAKETAYCKECAKDIDFDTAAIEKHIDKHKKTDAKTKRSDTNVSIEDYAKEHGFRHNRADDSYYCLPCTRRLSSTLDTLKNHVASRIHKENTQEKVRSDVSNKAPTKVPLFEYIKSFEIVEYEEQGFSIINDKFWLNSFGFFLIAKVHERIICHGCNIDLTTDNVLEHTMMSQTHRDFVTKCLFISSMENEFIREIKLDVYHCGYCNITEDDWDDMLDHLTTEEHKRMRAKAEKCLSGHRPSNLRVAVEDVDNMIRQFVRFQRRG